MSFSRLMLNARELLFSILWSETTDASKVETELKFLSNTVSCPYVDCPKTNLWLFDSLVFCGEI